MPISTHFGTWHSPISPSMLTESTVSLGQLAADGDSIYWVEVRPMEAGRSVIVRYDGTSQDVTPEGFNSRTRVHEYGGGAFVIDNGRVLSCSFGDQRVYRLDGSVRPITPEPTIPAGDRYANSTVVGDRVIAVREQHRTDGEAITTLVTFPIDGSSPPEIITQGHDFYSTPVVSPSGQQLAWLAWNHPNMPWDGTLLYMADLATDGTLTDVVVVAGGADESIFQPAWSPDGILHFVSDRTGWWNLYRLTESIEALTSEEADHGFPQWLFGYRTYVFLPDGRVAIIATSNATQYLALVGPGTYERVELGYDTLDPYIAVARGRIWLIAASRKIPSAVVGVDLDDYSVEMARQSARIDLDDSYLSSARPITFPTTDQTVAHAFYYPPRNPDFTAPEGELPPLVVWTHGGPTGHTNSKLKIDIQFWTSRGFAVVDVNYRGSSGFGREYRNALRGRWGVIDTEDSIAAAQFLVDSGEVDGERLAIRGGSAGGYTTLCALTFHDQFSTGASHFGVGDLEALARDTHKFESRYLDSMVGPYPERRDLYQERSPANFTDRLSRPMLILQGLDDEVVPPAQAEAMVDALASRGIPHAYLAFEGEGHGFRKAENIEWAAEAELWFYGWVFGFKPAGDIRPIEIRNT